MREPRFCGDFRGVNMKKLFVIVAVLLLLAGCSNRVGDFTILSTKNIDLSHGADFKRLATRIKVEEKVPIVLGIRFGRPDIKTAIDHAIEKTPGAVALTDAVIIDKWFNFFIFGETGYEVEGTPLIDPNLKSSYK